jgi:hypothetical protein
MRPLLAAVGFHSRASWWVLCVVSLALVLALPILAYEGDGIIEEGEDEAGELARATQNPVADLISVPFQNNTGYDFGPRDRTQNVLNIQPVLPFSLNDDWNLITRTIFPIVSQPSFARGQDRNNGTGDISLSLFLSPVERAGGQLIWGGGPVLLIPTASDDRLGADKWGAGLSAVGLTIWGPIVAGSLFSNVWNLEGNDDFSVFTWQYFVNWNFDDGWYLSSSPIITANWEEPHDAWTVPFGGGFGKVHRFGKLPVNLSFQAFYNVEKPEFGPDWSTRFQVQLLFPK